MSLRTSAREQERSHNSLSMKNSETHAITQPGQMDVLCGRGRGFFDHPGNRRMLSIISTFKPKYQTASKAEKSSIAQKVLRIIMDTSNEEAPPRFLKKKSSGKDAQWFELSEREIHKKVAHTLREQKTIVKACKNFSLKQTKELRNVECASETYVSVEPLELFHSVSLSSHVLPSNMMAHLESPTNSVSDDEYSLIAGISQAADSTLPRDVQCVEEPLSFKCEPVFNEREVDSLLHTVLDEDDAEDIILDSFLDGVDLVSSMRSTQSQESTLTPIVV